MARIRYRRYSNTSMKDQPKVAYFHNENFNKAIKKINTHNRYGKGVTTVVLNEQQGEDYRRVQAARKNPRKLSFHDKNKGSRFL